jgi:hypothetical protein
MGGGYGINVRGIPRGNQEWSIPRQKKMLDIIKNKEGKINKYINDLLTKIF